MVTNQFVLIIMTYLVRFTYKGLSNICWSSVSVLEYFNFSSIHHQYEDQDAGPVSVTSEKSEQCSQHLYSCPCRSWWVCSWILCYICIHIIYVNTRENNGKSEHGEVNYLQLHVNFRSTCSSTILLKWKWKLLSFKISQTFHRSSGEFHEHGCDEKDKNCFSFSSEPT